MYPARVQSSFDNLMEMEGKNPISILNEMYPGVQYLLLSSEVSCFIAKKKVLICLKQRLGYFFPSAQ